MAREGRGGITGNILGQSLTSSSPCTHVQGAYGAPTGAVGGAASGRRGVLPNVPGTPVSHSNRVFHVFRTQWVVLSAENMTGVDCQAILGDDRLGTADRPASVQLVPG